MKWLRDFLNPIDRDCDLPRGRQREMVWDERATWRYWRDVLLWIFVPLGLVAVIVIGFNGFGSAIAVIVLSSVVPFIIAFAGRRHVEVRAIRRAVRQRSFCGRCGYDLRELPPTQPQCPECGEIRTDLIEAARDRDDPRMHRAEDDAA